MSRAILLSIALVAISLSVIATKAAVKNAIPQIAGPQIAERISCEQQIWPTFSKDCLLTIRGEKAEREFRVVSF